MILNPSNSSNPATWGKKIHWILEDNGRFTEIEPISLIKRVKIPNTFDFLENFYPNNPLAREYFKK